MSLLPLRKSRRERSCSLLPVNDNWRVAIHADVTPVALQVEMRALPREHVDVAVVDLTRRVRCRSTVPRSTH